MIKYLATLFLSVTVAQNRIIDGHTKLLKDAQDELKRHDCTVDVEDCAHFKAEEELQLRFIEWINK